MLHSQGLDTFRVNSNVLPTRNITLKKEIKKYDLPKREFGFIEIKCESDYSSRSYNCTPFEDKYDCECDKLYSNTLYNVTLVNNKPGWGRRKLYLGTHFTCDLDIFLMKNFKLN